jgi:hypothetical protein
MLYNLNLKTYLCAMIIFNVTTILDENIQQEFLDYMQKVHMPELLATHIFTDCKLFKLTEPQNEGVTYCAQYFLDTKENLEKYRSLYALQLDKQFNEKFENQFVQFSSVLESV